MSYFEDDNEDILIGGQTDASKANLEAESDELIGSGSSGSPAISLEMMMAELASVYGLQDDKPLADSAQPSKGVLDYEQANLRLFEDLHLPARWANYFGNAGIYTVSDLVGKDISQLQSVTGIGKTAIDLLEEGLALCSLPQLDSLARMRLQDDCEDALSNSVRRTRVSAEDLLVSPFGNIASSIGDSTVQHTLLETMPQESASEEVFAFGDRSIISNYSALFDALPTYPKWLYGPYEYISTFLSLSVDYCILDFGLNSAEKFYSELLIVLAEATEFEDASDEFISLARSMVPNVLTPIRISWVLPDLNLEGSRYLTIADLIDENASFVSSYVALSIVDSFAELLDDYDSSVELADLIRHSFADLGARAFAERDVDVFLKRNGIGFEPMTLEEIAIPYNLTRESIRQIELKTNKRINLLRSRRLLPLRASILGVAVDLGLFGDLDDLNAELANRGILKPNQDIAGFLSLFPEVEIQGDGDNFLVADYPCPSCSRVLAIMGEIAQTEELVFADEFFERVGCSTCEYHLTPKISHLTPISGLSISGDCIGPANDPRMKLAGRPSSVRARVRSILAFSRKAMSYDEMIEAYAEKYGETVQKRRVMSHMGGSDDVILWGKGTYIYKDFAPFPQSLISYIAERCKELFRKNKVPILGVGGIFDLFSTKLEKEGVPTEHALYSLIRLLHDGDLILREYPWICDASSVKGRTSFAKYFYSVLAANNGFITDEHAEQIAEKCMAQSFALGGLAEYSDYVIRANGGWYDVEAAGFNMAGVASLALEVSEQMGENDIVSTVKVFEDYKERCLRYGVKSYDILYYLIDMIEDDLPIEATRRPHLVKSTHKGLSVIGAMRLYISSSEHPVSKEELYEEFAVKRRVKLRNICAAILVNDDIIQVGPDLLWSREKIEIDDDFIAAFDRSLSERIKHATKHADLFYSRRDVLPTFKDLPSPRGLTWNTQLLKTVFSKSLLFNQFGEDANCLVYMADNPSIDNAEAFFLQLLESEFMGWAPFDRFADYCRSYSIEDDLKPEFFDAFASIVADEFSIQTA